MKAFGDLGLAQAGIKLIGPGDITTDEELPGMGDAAIGTSRCITTAAAGDRPANKAFVAAYKAEFGAKEEPGFLAADAYDGMAAIFHVDHRAERQDRSRQDDGAAERLEIRQARAARS